MKPFLSKHLIVLKTVLDTFAQSFLALNIRKKAGIFDGPEIRKLLNDQHFVATMSVVEARAWKAFSKVVHFFFGNMKANNYSIELVQNFSSAFRTLGAE